MFEEDVKFHLETDDSDDGIDTFHALSTTLML